MKKIIVILALLLSGCATFKPSPILTSKEESWYIPKGVEFQAKKKPEEALKTYKAEDDLMVLYMGSYSDLEKCCDKCSK